MFGLRRGLRATIAALAIGAVTLSGCADWDASPAATSSDLREQVATAKERPDPRELEGVVDIDTIAEVEPVADDPEPDLPVSVTDGDGYDVTIEDVSRILPLDLYGSYSKTISGLGLGDNIVGRTVSSTEPSLADLPVVTQGGHNLNVEAILELDPTLVMIDHSIGPREAIDQIRDAGITTVIMQPERKLDTIAEDIMQVAQTVGLPDEGEKLGEQSQADLDASLSAIDNLKPDEPMRVAFVYARGTGGVFFILGPEEGTDELIEGVGAIDAAKEAGITDLVPATAEALADLNPDAFIMMTKGLDSTGGIEGLLERPGVAQTTAGQKQRIVTLPDGDSLAFGPMAGEVLLRTAAGLYDPSLLGEDAAGAAN